MIPYVSGNIQMNKPDNHHKTNKASFKHCLKGTVTDRLLLILMLFAIGLLWFEIQKQLSHGLPTAYVYHQQRLLAEYPIPTDDTIIHVPAMGELGESDIEISKKGVRFVSSPCTTHHCTLAGHKAYAGSVLACVPNHIMVVVRGSSQGNEHTTFDAVAE